MTHSGGATICFEHLRAGHPLPSEGEDLWDCADMRISIEVRGTRGPHGDLGNSTSTGSGQTVTAGMSWSSRRDNAFRAPESRPPSPLRGRGPLGLRRHAHFQRGEGDRGLLGAWEVAPRLVQDKQMTDMGGITGVRVYRTLSLVCIKTFTSPSCRESSPSKGTQIETRHCHGGRNPDGRERQAVRRFGLESSDALSIPLTSLGSCS